MKTYNVAMVAACPFPANHGSPASIREMSQALIELGHRVHVVTYPIRQEIPADGIVIHRVPKLYGGNTVTVGPTIRKPILDLMMIKKLVEVVRKERIDIIHAHNYEGALVGYCAKLITGRPLLYNAVNTMSDELPSYHFIRPHALAVWLAKVLDNVVPRLSDHITAVSEELKASLVGRNILSERITVVPAGVNVEMFDGRDPRRMRDRYGIGERPLIVYTGTLDHFQGLDYLFKALRRVVEIRSDVRLLLVGSIVVEEHQRRYEALARDLGLSEHILFTGATPLDDLPDYLAAADLAVLPRPSCPGHPVKLLNYMAAGKAIVSFRGSAKGLRNMYNGIVVDDRNWEALARGMEMLVKDPGLAAWLGERAKESIAGNFDWVSLARGISILYDGMMSPSDRGRIGLDEEALRRFIRSSYTPVFVNRRRSGHALREVERRRNERRRAVREISFLERRQMTYE